MGINLDTIKDPSLRRRVEQALNNANQLSHEIKTCCPIQSPKPEPAVRHELHGSVSGAKKSPPRVVVRIKCCRSKLLDPDNLCPKSLIDGLRYAGLIPGDEPDKIELVVTQEKCDKKDERTEIELTF